MKVRLLILSETFLINVRKKAFEQQKYVIDRELSTEHIKIKKPPHIENNDNFVFSDKLNDEDISKIEASIKKFKKIGNHVDLSYLYNNLETLEIQHIKCSYIKKLFHKVKYRGYYSTQFNKISLLEKNAFDHELLHCSSSLFFNGTHYSGFSQIQDKKIIGLALDEGYTNLLGIRYFNDTFDTYFLETRFAQALELIIGRKKMENFYFKSDLYGLIKELEKYSNIRSIIWVLKAMDFINLNDLNKTPSHEVELFRNLIKEVNVFLINCFFNKNEEILNSNNIDDLKYMYSEYNKLIDIIGERVFIGKKSFTNVGMTYFNRTYKSEVLNYINYNEYDKGLSKIKNYYCNR